MTFLDCMNLPKLDFTRNLSGSKMIKFQQSQASTSHFESFWSKVFCLEREKRMRNKELLMMITKFECSFKQMGVKKKENDQNLNYAQDVTKMVLSLICKNKKAAKQRQSKANCKKRKSCKIGFHLQLCKMFSHWKLRMNTVQSCFKVMLINCFCAPLTLLTPIQIKPMPYNTTLCVSIQMVEAESEKEAHLNSFHFTKFCDAVLCIKNST